MLYQHIDPPHFDFQQTHTILKTEGTARLHILWASHSIFTLPKFESTLHAAISSNKWCAGCNLEPIPKDSVACRPTSPICISLAHLALPLVVFDRLWTPLSLLLDMTWWGGHRVPPLHRGHTQTATACSSPCTWTLPLTSLSTRVHA